METRHKKDFRPKQISGLNTYCLIQYSEKDHPPLDLSGAIETISGKNDTGFHTNPFSHFMIRSNRPYATPNVPKAGCYPNHP
jgi:hypothetical protein